MYKVKTKKVFIYGIGFSVFLGMLGMYSPSHAAATTLVNAAAKEEKQSLTIEGVVAYRDLEGGFYEVNGYRLVGTLDFKKFLGKKVIVKGELDTSPSIYMMKAIKVQEIVKDVLEEKIKFVKELQQEIINLKQQIANDKEDLPELKQQLKEKEAELNGFLTWNKDVLQKLTKESGAIGIQINGTRLFLDKTPLLKKGRVLIAETDLEKILNIKFVSNEKGQIKIAKKGVVIVFDLLNHKAYINNQAVILESPAEKANEVAMLPLRFVCEALQYDVKWNAKEKVIEIQIN